MTHERLPEKILQFGEGNFLRAFADWMIDGANRHGLFGGRVIVLNNTERGSVEQLQALSCRYDVLLRGFEDGAAIERRSAVESISRAINPYQNFDEVLRAARQPDLRFVISNTTEAGIVFDTADAYSGRPPRTFPGKLTRLLHERYLAFEGDPSRGWIVLPCELIERNGERLREMVLRIASVWDLESRFQSWVTEANVFANTLVDRIVTGHPGGDYPPLTVAAEPYHLWVIEAPEGIAREFPLREAGFDVIWTDNLEAYRERKVRLLNGAHTTLALAAYLAGKRTVLECMEDPVTRGFLERALYDEIVPTVQLPRPELERFAASVLERFRNPFLAHALRSIALNSVAKYRTRVVPSLRAGRGERLTFALAALIEFYRTSEPADEPGVLGRFAELFGRCPAVTELSAAVLGERKWWGDDLNRIPGLTGKVAGYLSRLREQGSYAVMAALAGSVK